MMEQKRIGEHFNFCIAMKNLFKSIMIVAAAAMSFASCSNNFTEEAVSGEKIEINVNATNDEITRSAFGEPSEGSYPTLWDGEEKFVMNANDSNGDTTVNVTAKFSTDLRSVNLSASFEFEAPQTSYTAYAMVPKSACVFTDITANKGWQVTIPTAQTTGANSCDPAAQILMGASETKTSATEAFNMTFKHAVAYGKMTLTNLNLGDATISSVAIEATKNIAGRFYINHKTLAYSDNSGAKSITINTTSSDNIWFALAPVDVSNTALKIVVNTNKGTFTKQVTMPANRKFELGKISIFKVDMDGIAIVAPVQYTLLTDVANLKVGDEVVIAAKDANFAISSTQNPNNRGQAAIKKSSDKSTISDPGSDVEIFTVEAGSASGTFAFKAQQYAGYIYAASSSSNYLRTQDNKDANASWAVSVTTAGVATIKAQGANTRNLLRYNETSSLFSCYGSGQKDVVIYHLAATPADPNAPSIVPADEVLEIEADKIYAETAVTLNNITEEVVVDWTEDWIDDALVEDYTLYITATKNETTVARQAVFTISANGVEAKVTLKQKGVPPVVEEKLPTLDKTAYYTFKKATTFSSAKWYAIVASGKAATGLASDLNYGYLQVANTEDGNAEDTIIMPASCAFGFTSTNGGYLIQQYDSKYIYQTGTYNSFNVSATIPTDGGVWSVTYANNAATIKNNSVSKWVQYDSQYNSYGSYDTQKGTNPTLYELVEVNNSPRITALSSTSLTYTHEGGSESVTATVAGNTATLSATSNVDWATTSVSGNTITITTAKNETTGVRNGVITVAYGQASKTIAISQDVKPAEGATKSVDIALGADLGIANGNYVTKVTSEPIEIVFEQNGNSSGPKYYTTGAATRLYPSNKMTIKGATITKITLTYTQGKSDSTTTFSANTGSLSNNIWTGSSSSVIFTAGGKGHARLTKVTVTYIQ